MNSKHRIRFTSYSKHCSFLGLILIFVAALTPSWEVLIHSNSVDKIRDRGLFYAYWFNQPPGDVALPRMVNYPAFEFLLIDDRPMNAHAPAYDNISYTTALLLMIGFVLASLKLATPVSPYNLGLIALHFILSLLATLFTSGAVAFYYFMMPEIPSAYSLDKCVTTRYGYSFFTCAFGTLLLIIAMIFQTAQIIYVIFHPEKWTIPTVYIATLRTPVRENKQIPFTRTFIVLCHLQQIVLRMGKIKDGVFQIAAGGSAGFLEVCLMQPLDLVKTRFQVQSSVADQTRYKSLVDCFLRIYRQEGGLAFYKGIVPPIIAETPKRAVKFFTFEQYRSIFAESKSINPACGYSLAGLLCGVTEAMVVNPFEAVKVRLQVDRQASVLEQNTFAMARQLIKQGGLGTNGINRGLSATMWRNGIWNMIYFGFYHSTKSYVASSDSELKHNLPIRIGLSFTAGCLACIGNTPFDVAKSRIQASIQTRAKYRSCLQSIAVIYREEGLLALYRGLLPKIMRLGPGGAVLMIAYEHIFEFR